VKADPSGLFFRLGFRTASEVLLSGCMGGAADTAFADCVTACSNESAGVGHAKL
jgi:hypothetical protein